MRRMWFCMDDKFLNFLFLPFCPSVIFSPSISVYFCGNDSSESHFFRNMNFQPHYININVI